ncbi:MAG: TldD protein [Myxococcota bacterium]|jgi:TldD protein
MDQQTRFFLESFDLDEKALTDTLGSALGPKVDYADLYFEHTVFESVSMEEGLVKKANRSLDQGVGVRVVAGDKTGYAHSDEIDARQLMAAAKAARVIARDTSAGGGVALKATPKRNLYHVEDLATDRPVRDKVELLQRIDAVAREIDPRIQEVHASFATERKTVAIINGEGVAVGDERPLCRLNVSVIAQDGSDRQIGSAGGGGRHAFDWFYQPSADAEERFLFWVREAARRALLLLDAVPAPAGTLPVVLGPGWPGILLHEAIGHGLEGDFNRKGTSAFAELMGKSVGSSLCTVVDDGTIAGRRGSLNVDDEGTPTQRTTLIQDGVLTGYLQDRMNARLMGVAPTGNGRRESYAHIPMPRMTNTFMLPGESDPGDIVKSVKNGIYAVSFGGGQVDITNGKFVFSMNEAYLIENGEITRPLKGATLIGSGPDVLKKVTMVGNDLALDQGVGTCGKEGQSVPVGVGLPTILVDGITVGGTAG